MLSEAKLLQSIAEQVENEEEQKIEERPENRETENVDEVTRLKNIIQKLQEENEKKDQIIKNKDKEMRALKYEMQA